MKIIDIDFRFVESYCELAALGEFLDVINKQLNTVINKEKKRLESRIQKKKKDLDEIELSNIHREYNDRVYELLPRYFRSPFLVTLWAVSESAIIEVGDYIQKQKDIPLNMKDIRGKNFLDQANKYFKYILEFKLFTKEAYDRLEMLRILRNVIAHCNGRLDAIKNKEDLKKLKKWNKEKIGITLLINSIIFSELFLKQTYNFVNAAIIDLLDRTRKSFPK
ncbi:MAG: hypothetical protein ISS29_09225 [Candidatus Marinimicrobia bacterium]|nr:hypothetical protein [Candidatus Neomarinimicrobiota bacterium]